MSSSVIKSTTGIESEGGEEEGDGRVEAPEKMGDKYSQWYKEVV